MNNNLLNEISVVIPVYGCSTSIIELSKRLENSLSSITKNYEIIYVNDGSKDDAWSVIEELCKHSIRNKGINLSRNFGQHHAIHAGLEHSNGNWVVVMDCDLQDQPENIIHFYNKAQEGFDVVQGRRNKRNDNFLRRIASKLYYKFLSFMTETKQDSTIANFGIYKRNVITAICQMKDNIRYFPAMVQWVGFSSTTINIDHGKRETGKSSYSLRKLFRLGMDVTISFSEKPLKLAVKTGLLFSFASILFAIYNIIKYINGEILVSGWTTIIVSIWFLSGIIIFLIGILGLYVSRIFDKVKDRPLYIIKEKCNL